MIFKVSFATELSDAQFRDKLQALMPYITAFIQNATGQPCSFKSLSKMRDIHEARFSTTKPGLLVEWVIVEQWFDTLHGHNYRCTRVEISPDDDNI